MKKICQQDIKKMDSRYRVNFINSLTGFKSLNLTGTISSRNRTNLAPVSSVIHFGARPPLMGMLIRPSTVRRHTFENILSTGAWTLNHVTEETFEKAHQCSARYDERTSEFTATGLEEFYTNFRAPYVKEARIKIGLELEERIDIVSNGTHLLIGSVQEVIMDKNYITDDGFIDIEKAGTITVSGLDSYHKTESLKRLEYAKPPVN